MLQSGDHILVGLSGGPDSVCLLSILNILKNEFGILLSAGYIDHCLRPDETPSEIEFCKGLCSTLNIPFIVRAVDVESLAKSKGINKQEAARELRYDALNRIALDIAANKIALGHNADDQAETILMRLFRGAGPLGLSGMPPIRIQRSKITLQKTDIIRPLIEIQRAEIEEYLQREDISFIIDSSNLKKDYLRNRIRSFLMPSIKKINKDIVHTLSRTADILRDEERFFDVQVAKILMKLISRKTQNTIELFLSPMEATDTVLLRRVLRRAIDETAGLRGIGFIHIEEIINLIKSGKSGDRICLPKDIRAIKGYATLIITSERPAKLNQYIIESCGEVILSEASIVIKISLINIDEAKDYSNKKNIALIDADKAHFPMLIRPRQKGDYFYPLGFGKRKKLQDYFVDEKVPRDERDLVPLLISDNNIVWVIGYRLDERYKVDKETKRILKLEIKPLKT